MRKISKDLRIQIVAELDKALSTAELQKQLESIQSELKLNIGIDNKVISQIQELTGKLNKEFQNSKKVIEEALMPDGTKVKRTYFDGLNGEFSETVENAKNVKKSIESSVGVSKEFTSETNKLNQEMAKNLQLNREVIKENNKGLSNLKQQYSDENKINQLLVERNKQGDIIGAQYNVNHERARKLTDEERKQTEEIQRQIELKQRELKIRSDELRRQYPNINKKELDSILTDSKAFDKQGKSLKDVNNFYREMNLRMKETVTQTKMVTANTNTLAGAFQNAMIKFPINLYLGGIKTFLTAGNP